jgi:cell division GTPase FtsZ
MTQESTTQPVIYSVNFESAADATLVIRVASDVPVAEIADRFLEVIEQAVDFAAVIGSDVSDPIRWDVEVIFADGEVVWPHLPN